MEKAIRELIEEYKIYRKAYQKLMVADYLKDLDQAHYKGKAEMCNETIIDLKDILNKHVKINGGKNE
ncbi:MAG: hypothetical protein ACFFDN_13985 [Candidatus Hodarchaeota archaeon]